MSTALGAVIVSYNSADVIGRCLASLDCAAEIVVVDNASGDQTREVVAACAPRAKLIANDHNRGFAAAVNQGVRALSSPLVLLLNPDTVLETPLTADHPLVIEALQPEVGLVAGKLVDAQGEFQRGFSVRSFPTPAALAAEVLLLNRLWPGNPINRRYRRLDFDSARAQPCEQPAGAFLVFRSAIFEKIGGFDEGFSPLWFEDADFCLRLQRAGFQARYQPAAVAAHLGGHSLRDVPLQARQSAWYGSLLRFADKHFSAIAAGLLRPCVMLGLAVRGLSCVVGLGERGEARAYFVTIGRVVSPRNHTAAASSSRSASLACHSTDAS